MLYTNFFGYQCFWITLYDQMISLEMVKDISRNLQILRNWWIIVKCTQVLCLSFVSFTLHHQKQYWIYEYRINETIIPTGFAQGLRRLTGGLAQILGPLWATSLIPKPYNNSTPVYLLMGVLAGLMILALVSNMITTWPKQNGRHFADNSFRCILLVGNHLILIQISLRFVPKGTIDNKSALV